MSRSIEVAKAAVYNLRFDHHVFSLPPIKDWYIAALTGIKPPVAEVQQLFMAVPERVLRRAEIFERRVGCSYV